MNKKQRLIAFHLLNDRSGSPKVLRQIVQAWVHDGHDVWLYTSLHQDGFLSGIPGVNYLQGWYRFQANPWLRLLCFSLSQLVLFLRMLPVLKKTDIVYVNTVLPFGAALLAKLKGARVIYHVHESTVQPRLLKWFLFRIAHWAADDIICVSQYVAAAHPENSHSARLHLVYNALDQSFIDQATPVKKREKPTNVLMACSLKWYKGVHAFLQLAQDHADYRFRLVLNASQAEIDAFFQREHVPGNTELYPAQQNLHPFFAWADVLLNLSRPDGWIETFGLTVVEGMAYGLPALVPPVGGISEVIEEGVSGFGVDSRNLHALSQKLRLLMENPLLYRAFSLAASERLQLFNEAAMLKALNGIVWKQKPIENENFFHLLEDENAAQHTTTH